VNIIEKGDVRIDAQSNTLDSLPGRSRDLGNFKKDKDENRNKKHNVDSTIILDRIKELLDIKSDYVLSKRLSISSNTIYSWKSRDSIDVWNLFQKLPKLDWNYVFYGEGFEEMLKEDVDKDIELIEIRNENLKLKEELLDLRKILVNLSTIIATKG